MRPSLARPVAARTLVARALSVLLMSACGGGGDGPAAPPAISAVSVSPGSVTLLGVGSSASVGATISPSNATGAISWQSSNPAVATVSGSGASASIAAVSGGSATITATAGGVSGTTAVTVTPIVRSITPSRTTASVLVGATTPLSATLGADAGAPTALTWTSSAASIATIDANGVVSGIAPGTATITVASAAFPAVNATVAVTVAFPLVRGVAVAPASPTVSIGQTRQLTATVDADAGTATNVTWNSATPTVATVSATGLVTAIATGTAVMRATSTANPTISGTTTVTVSAPTVRTITLAPLAPSISLGATQQFTLTFDADVGASTAVTWSSTNTSVATVNAGGLVTSLSPGSTTIRATSTLVPAVSAQTILTVLPPPALINWTTRSLTPLPVTRSNDAMQSWSINSALAFFIATGNDGDNTVNRYDGGGWTTQPLAPFDNLSAIGGTGTSTFVGNNAGRLASFTIFASLQPAFTEIAIPAVGCIRYIRPAGSGAIVLANAVPNSINCTNTTAVVVYNGTTWTRIQNPLALSVVNDIAGTSPTDIVAVGVGSTGIQRWNGSAWSAVTAPAVSGVPQSATFVGTDIVVTVGANGAARFNGTTWTSIAPPSPRPNTGGLIFTRLTTCGGQVYVGTTFDGRVFRLDNTTWTEIASHGVAVPGTYTTTVQCGADNVVRVLGSDGGVGRLSGANWVWETYTPWLFKAVAVRSNLAWATGGHGVVEKWDGTRWTIDLSNSQVGFMDKLTATVDGMVMAAGAGSPTGVWRKSGTWQFDAMSSTPLALWASSTTFALSLNTGNTAFRWDGSAWQSLTPPTGFNATNMDGTAPTFAMAVGNTISTTTARSFRWDGTSFIEVPVPVGVTTLLGVDAVSPTLAFAVSSNALLQFTGSQWSTVAGPTVTAGDQPWRGVAANSASDIYLLGTNGAVFHYDGIAWTRIASLPVAADVVPTYTSITLSPDGLGLITGFGGQLYHGSANASIRATAPSVRRRGK